MARSSKGITVIAEALLAIGVIGIAIMFALVAGNVIGFESGSFFSTSQRTMVDDISTRIERVQGYNGTTSIRYDPPSEQYVLTVQQHSTLTVRLPNRDLGSRQVEDVNVSNVRIEDARSLCIRGGGGRATISAGNCTGARLSEFCTGGGCVNDVCQPQYGEHCGNSGGDCPCPAESESAAASGFCEPDYTAPGFVDAPGAGDSTVDTVDNQCVNSSFVGVQGKGERCSQRFECGMDGGERMRCSPAAQTASVSGNYCCPQGTAWDPDAGSDGQCVSRDVYDVVYVPVKMESSDAPTYTDAAERTQGLLVNSGVFEGCADPSLHADRTVVPIGTGGACDISSCSDLSRGGSCFQKIEDCAEQYVGAGNFERALGICDNAGGHYEGGTWQPGECETESGYAGLCGKASDIPGDSAIMFTSNACQAGRGEPLEETGVHELGHTFGLPHVNICRDPAPSPSPGSVSPPGVCEADITSAPSPDPCIDPNRQDCTASESEAADYLMTYAAGHSIFGPDGLDWLKNNQFASYRWGCS